MTTVVLAAGGAAWEPSVLATLESARDVEVVRRCVDVAELVAVTSARSPQVAVVAAGLPGLDLDVVRRVASSGAAVLAVGDVTRAQSVGITWTVPPEQVLSAVRSSAATDAEPPRQVGSVPTGRLLGVWGPAGAPGRSVVAQALAADAASHGARVVLVDADVQGGVQAQLLGLLDEASGLVAACRDANRGALELDRHVLPVDPGLGLLSGIARADMWSQVRLPALERVLEAVRGGSDVGVVDLGPGLDPGGAGRGPHVVTHHVLEAVDDLVVVGRADPTGIARLVRSLHDLREVPVPPPWVVLNRVRRSVGWDVADLARTVQETSGHAVAAALPDDPGTLDAAARTGRTALRVNRSSSFVRAVRGLTAHGGASRV